MDKKFDVAAVAEVSNNTYIDRLKRTKKQEVLTVIEALKYEHRYGVSAMMGPFNEREAEHHYKRLLNALAEFPGLTPEEITELKEVIENLIKDIPNIEKEKKDECEEYEFMVEEAFIAAKARFEELSPAKKLKLMLAGKDPENIDIRFKSVSEINKLYRKEERQVKINGSLQESY